MRDYPQVLSEDDTLTMALAGKSLARFGDGEIKIALGNDAKSQRGDPRLARILRDALQWPGKCLVCVPNIDSATPKATFWRQYRAPRVVGLYHLATAYGSAFVTRPDSAPWIDTPDYWRRVRSIWDRREVVLVRGSTKSLTAGDLHGAEFVEEIVASRQHAFQDHPWLLRRLRGERRRVILCLGATATALAWQLAQDGVHALDLGHIGMFFRKLGADGKTGLDYTKG